MNKFEKLNYYEMLEIPVNASSFEIKRAYRNAIEVYSDHSLLTYSLFDAEERSNILKKLEDAYSTLIDRTKRTAYDASLSDKSSNTDIQQDHKLSLLGDNGLQKSLRQKSVEIEDLGLTRSFWGRVYARMVVIISLLGLIIIALFAILWPSDLPNGDYLFFTRGENHAEAIAKQVEVEETDFGNQENKIKEEAENLGDKAVSAPESISLTEDLHEVYENIASLANIRERPTIDSKIIAKIPRGKEVSVVGKDSEWVKLKLDNHSIGWIHRSLIRKRPTNTDSSEVVQ
jgi:hypothetical protein